MTSIRTEGSLAHKIDLIFRKRYNIPLVYTQEKAKALITNLTQVLHVERIGTSVAYIREKYSHELCWFHKVAAVYKFYRLCR